MAFLEWRCFTFFDIHNNVDDGRIASSLEDTTVSVTTSGNSRLVLCDTTGWAYLISRTWEITSFKVYELGVTLAQQLPHDPYLVTIGDDEPGINPLIKVWDWSRSDRHGNPIMVRSSRAVPSHLRATPATALAVHDNKTLLAVGFQDGSVSLFRGDITRQRSGKMKTLVDTGTSPITALAFKSADKLYIVSHSCVMVYWLISDRCDTLDTLGAAPHCSVLTDKNDITIASSNNAIYSYTIEGRGPCYALPGDKIRLNWFRNYLVITTNETINKQSSSNAPTPRVHHIKILDVQNKFIVFSKAFEETDAVFAEWGAFYILTKSKKIIYLEEKDLQSKLSLLFKKNLYDVAIRIASGQHYDAEGLTQIYKQYGDHLYSKGDFRCAIEQYIKTIGWLETSYVIRKYLESRHLEPLIFYLEELHKQGCASEDHTTLLLTCYVKIDQHDQQGKLKEFINSKDKAINFNVEVAIKVVRQVSIEDALSLAANYKQHDWYLKLMIEEKKDYKSALEYIADLEFDSAETYMVKYGHRLIQHIPEESTKFLMALCTDYKPRNKPLIDEDSLSGIHREPDRAVPDDFIHMFLGNSERLIQFLEHMTSVGVKCSKLVYNALIEHYIHVWSKVVEDEKLEYEKRVMKVLQDPDAHYDKDQTLVICQMLGFKTGILYLYEENKLWRAQVALHTRTGNTEEALAVCRRRGEACRPLWLDVLWSMPPPEYLREALDVIANNKLLSPILVINCLASTPKYTLGDIRKYLTNVLKSEQDTMTHENELTEKYRSEIQHMKKHIGSLLGEPCVFQSSRCAACNRVLELPTVHFLCQHSYHQYCLQSYSESERECLACVPQRRSVAPPLTADALHARLQASHDPYAVVSEYFGRGLFNKVTVITDNTANNNNKKPDAAVSAPVLPPAPKLTAQKPPAAISVAPIVHPPAPVQKYGPGAEAKLRQQEGQSKQVYVANAPKQVAPKGTSVIPVPEGRMRLLEQQKYSSSLEANLKNIEPATTHARHSPFASPKPHRKEPKSLSGSPKISAAISNASSLNPFEENYDEAKNPFADEEGQDPTNPFSADDDYDNNLNPFS